MAGGSAGGRLDKRSFIQSFTGWQRLEVLQGTFVGGRNVEDCNGVEIRVLAQKRGGPGARAGAEER